MMLNTVNSVSASATAGCSRDDHLAHARQQGDADGRGHPDLDEARLLQRRRQEQRGQRIDEHIAGGREAAQRQVDGQQRQQRQRIRQACQQVVRASDVGDADQRLGRRRDERGQRRRAPDGGVERAIGQEHHGHRQRERQEQGLAQLPLGDRPARWRGGRNDPAIRCGARRQLARIGPAAVHRTTLRTACSGMSAWERPGALKGRPPRCALRRRLGAARCTHVAPLSPLPARGAASVSAATSASTRNGLVT